MHGAQQHLWMHAYSLQKCVWTRIHTHIYTYTHVHIYMHTCKHRYIYTYIHIHIHICMDTYEYVHMQIYVHIHICIYICICTHVYMYLHNSCMCARATVQQSMSQRLRCNVQGKFGDTGQCGALPTLVGRHNYTERYDSLVVRETWLLQPVSPRILASPQTIWTGVTH